MSYVGYYNGAFLKECDIHLPIDNLAFTRGYSAFELLRTYKQEPFYLEAHLERFFASIALLELPKPTVNLEEIIQRLLILNPNEEFVFRLYWSEDLLVILTGKVVELPPSLYQNGIAVMTTPLARTIPLAKTTNYLAGQIALKQASRLGADEALYTNQEDELLELTRANFFCVMEDKLYTPKEGILFGITRRVVIEAAKELGIEVVEGPIEKKEIPHFKEAFLTSTLKEVLPISKIDSFAIPMGPLAKELRAAFPKSASRLATLYHSQ
ncbi:MAG: aminotransferase class IV [Verrucomicrobia bacterium]|nr:aminotransferase class IV [Verrucomicrobiota bacterium]